ncbi:MAG: hypothetical protein J0H15_02500 [Xanthomonadales bacterium]|nr:hypothetical protein [Xanthomonadales bacterium]
MRAWQHRLASTAALILLTSGLLAGMSKIPLSRLDVPYTFQGDAIDKLAQIHIVAENGWLFDAPRLGYPFGYDRLDFPRFDSLNYAILGPLAALTGESGLAMNLYYLAGFYLIGLTALFAFRRLGLGTLPALLCALVYAFLPYHLYRGVAHLTNAAYFLVPLAILVIAWLARGDLDPAMPGARKRWALALGTAVLLPLQMPYNGVFFALLAGVGCLIALARLPRWRSMWPTLVLVAATSCTFVAEQVPALAHKMEAGANLNTADRDVAEAELYALRLNQVLMPHASHRLNAFSDAKREFDEDMRVPAAEFRNQYLGAFGIIGLLALLWSLARAVGAPARANRDDALAFHVRTAALLAIAILLLAMSSGVFTLIAFWVTSKIRATNRIFPFLAFVCLLGSGWALQATLARIRPMVLRLAVFAAIGTLVLLDVTAPARFGNRTAIVREYDMARDYFSEVEQQLGPGAAVFQVPAVWYPEHPPVGRMGDYEEFKPYLFTRSLRFSYGSAHGRPGYAWSSMVASLHPADMVQRAYALGFSAILIDSLAYDGAALTALMNGLTEALQAQQPISSPDGRWRLFPLAACCHPQGQDQVNAAIASAFTYVPDGSPLQFGKGGLGGLYRAGGWHALEDWGVWSLGTGGRLRMQLTGYPGGMPLALSLDARALTGPDIPVRHVVVEANGQVLGEIRYSREIPSPMQRLMLPAGLIAADGMLELNFHVSPSASPRSAGINNDSRQLGIGLAQLAIGPAHARAGR